MIISGTTYRSIAAQNEFSYNFEVSINNSTGISTFGFSGDKQYLELFTFRSGEILDFNKRYVWSYNPREEIQISGNIGSGYLNYFINNNPVCLFSFNSGNYFKYLTLSSQDSVTEFDFDIYGKIPSYSFIYPSSGVNLGENIIAKIKNNEINANESFQIFSGNFTGQNFYSLFSFTNDFISGLKTGDLVFNYISNISASAIQSGIPPITGIRGVLTLNTNFGDITTEYNFNIKSPPFYFIDFQNLFAQLTGNISQNLYQRFYQYRLDTRSSQDQNIYIKYSNISGHQNNIITGLFLATGLISGQNISGFIYGQDFITGFGTGTIFSTVSDEFGNIISSPISGEIRQSQSATGIFNYYYDILITGVNSKPTFLKDFNLEYNSDESPPSLSQFFGKSVSISQDGAVMVIGATGNNSSDDLVTGEGNAKIYTKIFDQWILSQTLRPEQVENFFITGVSPRITGGLTGIEIGPSLLSFNNQQINTINLIEGVKIVNIFITGSYALDQNLDGPFFVEWLESSNNNSYFNFDLFDKDNVSRSSSFESKNGLYTGYIPTSSRFLRLNYPSQGGSGSITGLIDISYLGSSLQGMNFGFTADLNKDGTIIAIGAPRYQINHNLQNIGSVWVYTGTNNNWNLSQTIIGEKNNQYFGKSLSLEENILAVGGNTDDNVIVYEKIGDFFQEKSRLQNPITGFNGFGHSLDLSKDGQSLIVGAPSNNLQLQNIYNSGSAWLYDNKNYFKTWQFKQRINSNVISNSKIFFPAMGVNDYSFQINFLSYFRTLFRGLINSTAISNSFKYYDFRIGNIHYFVLDSISACGGTTEDGNISQGSPQVDQNISNQEYTRQQKEWFNKTISNSNAKYKFVFCSHPPFNTGGAFRGFINISPYKGWKMHLADMVFNGHEFIYQRLKLDSQNPNYLNVERIGNQLKITYKSNGSLFGTTQLKINIGYNDFQDEISADSIQGNMSFNNITNEWEYLYNITNNADYINFYFKSANGTLDRNTLNNRNYDYIYYLNDSNDFTKTVYNIVGNGGGGLNIVRNDPGVLNWQGLIDDDFYGFTRIDVYENGLKLTHFGIRSGSTVLQNEDLVNIGDTSTPILLSFAVISNWGWPTGAGTYSVPATFRSPNNNYYAEIIASTIRSQNINYIFGVGNYHLPATNPLTRINTSVPPNIDENMGQFYFDYIPCYRGVYTGYKQINPGRLGVPFVPITSTSPCFNPKFGINNSTWGNTTIDGFGESVYINNNGSFVAIGGGGNVGYLNNGSAWIFTGITNQINYSNLNWSFSTKITGNIIDDKYGQNVDINDNGRILISTFPNRNSGVFDDNGGVSIFTISPNFTLNIKQDITGDVSGSYGTSATINGNGDIIILGGPFARNNQNEILAGSVLLYTGDFVNNFIQKQKIQGSNVGDQFGSSVAVNKDGTVVVIGSIGYNGGGLANAGGAFIYTGNKNLGWTFKHELTGLQAFSELGASVAISDNGEIILVGGDRNSSNGGAAIVYTGNANLGWRQQQLFLSESAGDRFGHSVLINSNNLLLIGAPFNSNTAGINAGAVYVYTGNSNTNWVLHDKLIGNQANDRFGTSIDSNIDTSVIAIGADPRKITPFLPLQTGKTMIYTGNLDLKWRLRQTLTGSITGDGFGCDIAINNNGDFLVVGSPNDTINNFNVGSLQIFTGLNTASQNNLILSQNIINRNPNSSGNSFGFSIDGSNDDSLLLIGSPGSLNSSGNVYLYTGLDNNLHGLKQILEQPTRLGNSNLNFGFSVASNQDGSNFVIGTNSSQGIIYTFESDIYTNLVSNQTGLLTGIVTNNLGLLTWNNISITGTGLPGFVFIDKITGYKQATGIINFINNTGSGLSLGDTISINDINFTYVENPLSLFEFNSLDNFVNILNSGVTGNVNILTNLGVTGFKNNNQIILYSYLRSGEEGNSIKITRNAQNLNSIRIPFRYFQGGQTLRPNVSNWSGLFSGFFNVITRENSGIYIINNPDAQLVSNNVTGVIWIDGFNKWIVRTGVTQNSESPPLESFNNLIYNNSLQLYSGFLKVDRSDNYLSPSTSLFINFEKQVYTNTGEIIFNNLGKYEISGDNFIFTGILTG
jgi:hypothetical protein